GDAYAAGGDAGETVQPSPKKRKGSTVHKGRTMTSLHGPNTSSGDWGGVTRASLLLMLDLVSLNLPLHTLRQLRLPV
ncbi:hypothetical protein A2U01_0099520, partial [Trifolium medium]|nr:hypothetical protein [Trifolium medium]